MLSSLSPVYADHDLPESGGEAVYPPVVDSLLTLIDNSPGEEQMRLYPELLASVYELDEFDLYMELTLRFRDAAHAHGNKVKEAFAYALRISAMYSYNVPQEIFFKEAQEALDIIREMPGAEPHYFVVASNIMSSYMSQGNYEMALREAEKFYEEAHAMNNNAGMAASLLAMGEAYLSLEVYDKAEDSFREAISVAENHASAGVKGAAYKYLVDILINLDEYEKALEASREYEAFIIIREALPKAPKGEMNPHWFMNNLCYADAYIGLEQYDMAAERIRRAESYSMSEFGLGAYMLESTRLSMLMAQGKYAEAEKSLDVIDREYGDIAEYRDRLSLIGYRAQLYHEWGKFDRSSQLYKDYIELNDSIQRVSMAETLNTIRTQYEVDKLEMQQEQQKRSFRTRLIWLSIALVLLAAVITIVILDARRVRAKNRSLLDRIREQDKMEQENEHLRIEMARQDVAVPEDGVSDGKQGELYLQLKELMSDPAVFTDPDINRRSIAEKLGTNEKYVFDMVRKYYDMSISDYITNLRLNYSRNLLALPKDTRTIEAVAIDAGFNSRNTFHRLFKERYGMTPDEFRRLVAGS